jgi:MerR family transcriptional regulator/heat shock protein HspR
VTYQRAVFVISVAAELAGMHAQTLRMYERKGLVNPLRTPGGSRRYSEEDVALLRRIQELTNSGLNLEGVRRVIALESEVERLRAEVDQLRRQYRREIVPLSQVNGFMTYKRDS